MAYQYMKDQDLNPKESGANNPYHALLFQLTGKEMGRPRRKTAVNVWRKTQRSTIDAKVKTCVANSGATRDNLAALRDKVAREMFSALTETEQEHWKNQAIIESETALAAWKRDLESDPSTEPADRQRCIQGLVRVAQPFLDLICKATGWKATLIAGGPQPAQDGKLNIISVHSGLTSGDIEMNFGRAERTRFKNYFIPTFGSFLQKCYSPEECRARALRDEDGFMSLRADELEIDGATIDAVVVEQDTPSPQPTTIPLPAEASPQVPPSHGQPPPLLHVPILEPSLPPSPGPTPAPSPALSHGPTPTPSRAPSRSPTPAASLSPSHGALPALPPPSPHQSPHPFPIPSSRILTTVQAALILSAALQRTQQEVAEGTPTAKDTREQAISPGCGRKRGIGVAEGTNPSTSPQGIDAPLAKRLRTHKGITTIMAPSSTPTLLSPSRTTLTPASLPSIEPAQAKVTIPPDAPKWFENALSMFQAKDWGAPWCALIRAWAEFEVCHEFKEVVKLGTKNCPECIQEWMRHRWSATWKPPINGVSAYEPSFMKWWASLQPYWRLLEGGEIDFSAVEGDWGGLRRPGLRGLLNVIVGLFYWALEVENEKRGHTQWLIVVDDCRVVCERLLSSAA